MAFTHFPIQSTPATAARITNVPAGTISATNVQDAINELDTDITNLSTEVDNLEFAASEISYTPGGVSADDVQQAIDELATAIENVESGAAAGGANTQIQFNDAGALSGDSALTWNKTTNKLLQTVGTGGGGFFLTATNPNVGSDASGCRAVDFTVITEGTSSNPNFSNEEVLRIDYTANHGQATNVAKKTFFPINIGCTYRASGQKFLYGGRINSYGMSDTSIFPNLAVKFAGGPVSGDEGQGYWLATELSQQQFLSRATVGSVTRTTLSTTITQTIVASLTPQVVTVASTTGANVGDWVVIGQQVASGSPSLEAVLIEAVGVGTITGVFVMPHSSGATVTPALVLGVSTIQFMGQDRLLINRSQSNHTTGLVTGKSGGALTGTATNWTVGMVGGDATNIGAISMEADDYTGAPFDVDPNQLKSWYQIISISSTTSLAVHSFSVAGDASYRGDGPGDGVYEIRPSAKILRIIPSPATLVCETSAHTWAVNDEVEAAICPYPDVTGFTFNFGSYTPGGTYRDFMKISNVGPRQFEYCLRIGGAFETGMLLTGTDIGIDIASSEASATMAIALHSDEGGFSDAAGRIRWDGTNSLSIGPNTTNLGMEIDAVMDGEAATHGKLLFASPGSGINSAGTNGLMRWNGNIEQTIGVGKPQQIFWNTAPHSTNFERAVVGFNSFSTFVISTVAGGTGIPRWMAFGTPGGSWFIEGEVSSSGHLGAGTDNIHDIGYTSDFRPRDVHVGRDVRSARVVKSGSTTVGGLPTAATAGAGGRMFVTDATSSTFLSTATGGGAILAPVVSDGTNWLIG